MCQDILRIGKHEVAEKIPKGEMRAELFRVSSSLSHQKASPPLPTSGFSDTVPESHLGCLNLLCFFKEANVRAADACLPGDPSPRRLDYLYSDLGNERDPGRGRRLSRLEKGKEFQYHRLVSYSGKMKSPHY